jgi:hypothetical protein
VSGFEEAGPVRVIAADGDDGDASTWMRRSRVGLCSPRRSAWNTKMSRRCTAQGCADLVAPTLEDVVSSRVPRRSGQSQPLAYPHRL